MKKNMFIILFATQAFMACICINGKKKSEQGKVYQENKLLFRQAVSCLVAYRNGLGPSSEEDVVHIDGTFIKKAQIDSSAFKEIKNLLYAKKIQAITYYPSREIEFLIDFHSNLLLTETQSVILYTSNNYLPLPYQHWQIKKTIEPNWWYLENTDAQY